MNEEIKELAKYRLEKAEETFRDACTLLEKGSLTSAINRFYYAAFYGTRSLLATKGLDSSKHSGVISLFNQHFVKSNLFDKEKAQILKISFEKRQDSDYEDFVQVPKEEVESLKPNIQEFLEECRLVLEKLIRSHADKFRRRTVRRSKSHA